jgi:hypothetical protein
LRTRPFPSNGDNITWPGKGKITSPLIRRNRVSCCRFALTHGPDPNFGIPNGSTHRRGLGEGGLVVAGRFSIDPPLVLPSLFHAPQRTTPSGSLREPRRPVSRPTAKAPTNRQGLLATTREGSTLPRLCYRATSSSAFATPGDSRPTSLPCASLGTL